MSGSPSDSGVLRPPPRPSAPTCCPLCDSESFRARGSWRGRPCPACTCSRHPARHWPRVCAAFRELRSGQGRGARAQNAGTPPARAPVRRRRGQPARGLVRDSSPQRVAVETAGRECCGARRTILARPGRPAPTSFPPIEKRESSRWPLRPLNADLSSVAGMSE